VLIKVAGKKKRRANIMKNLTVVAIAAATMTLSALCTIATSNVPTVSANVVPADDTVETVAAVNALEVERAASRNTVGPVVITARVIKYAPTMKEREMRCGPMHANMAGGFNRDCEML
jgi:hypothetical protein